MKPIKITGHATFEMRRRGIKRTQVVRTIRSPDQVVSSVKGRKIYQSLIGSAGKLLLRVIVKEDTAAYHVITAYKTSNIKKYWRKP